MPPFRETALGPRPIARGRSLILMPDKYIFRAENFVAPVAGLYTFYAWSPSAPGGYGYNGGEVPIRAHGSAAGNFGRKTVEMAKGQSIYCTAGRGGINHANGSMSYSIESTETTINFPTGTLTLNTPKIFAGVYNQAALTAGWDVTLQGGKPALWNGSSWNPPTVGQGDYAGTTSGYGTYAGGGGSAPGDVVVRGGNGGWGQEGYNNAANPNTFGGFPGGGVGGTYLNPFSGPYYGFKGSDGLVLVIQGEPRK